MSPSVSVIVPAYNCEATLERGLNSVLNQSFEDFEIIIVNDGSTDGTAAICDDYAAADNRVKVIHTDNRGVSSARNTGIQSARGKYLRFLDSDDSLAPESLYEMFSCHESDRSDFVIGGYTELDNNLHILKKQSVLSNGVEPTESFLDSLYSLDADVVIYPCWAISYTTDIVRRFGILFPEDISMGEDQVFSLRYLHHARLVSTITDSGYRYVNDVHGSLTKQFHSNMYEIQLRLVNDTLRLCGKKSHVKNIERIEKEFAKRIATWLVAYYALGAEDFEVFSSKMFEMRKDRRYEKHNASLVGTNLKERIILLLFRLSFWRTLWLTGRLYAGLKSSSRQFLRRFSFRGKLFNKPIFPSEM